MALGNGESNSPKICGPCKNNIIDIIIYKMHMYLLIYTLLQYSIYNMYIEYNNFMKTN